MVFSAELRQDVGPEILEIRSRRKLAAEQMQLILPGRRVWWLAGTDESKKILVPGSSPDKPSGRLWLARSNKGLTDHVWMSQQMVNSRGRDIRGGASIPLRTWGEDVTYDWKHGPEFFEEILPVETQVQRVENLLKILDLIAAAQDQETVSPRELLLVAA